MSSFYETCSGLCCLCVGVFSEVIHDRILFVWIANVISVQTIITDKVAIMLIACRPIGVDSVRPSGFFVPDFSRLLTDTSIVTWRPCVRGTTAVLQLPLSESCVICIPCAFPSSRARLTWSSHIAPYLQHKTAP